jgi:hypothetical protein
LIDLSSIPAFPAAANLAKGLSPFIKRARVFPN